AIPTDLSHLQIHAVVLIPPGTLIQETGIQPRGVQKTDSQNRLLYLDAAGKDTLTNTGVPSITDPPGGVTGQLIWLDAQGNKTFSSATGIPYIVRFPADRGGLPVYLNANHQRVFTNTGTKSMIPADAGTA